MYSKPFPDILLGVVALACVIHIVSHLSCIVRQHMGRRIVDHVEDIP